MKCEPEDDFQGGVNRANLPVSDATTQVPYPSPHGLTIINIYTFSSKRRPKAAR